MHLVEAVAAGLATLFAPQGAFATAEVKVSASYCSAIEWGLMMLDVSVSSRESEYCPEL